jgi:Trk K+ transport system NAD-binding subunit
MEHILLGGASVLEDPECPAALPLNRAQLIVSTIPQLDVNLALLDALRQQGYEGRKVLTAHSEYDAARLKEAGADMILSPFIDAAREAADAMVAAVPKGDR